MARPLFFAVISLVLFPAHAQLVDVTVSLDQPKIKVGETTTLHVYAQIVPDQRATTDRIFSWNVDLLNTGAAADLRPADLSKPTSDRNPKTSSSGDLDGANIRGIYDTFMNLPAAGRDAPVELFSIPVQGTAPGKTTLQLQAGTGAGLSADFIVAPLGGGDPLLGGIYSAAQAELEVTTTLTSPTLRISVTQNPQTQKQETSLSFTALPGADYFVEYQDNLSPTEGWQPLPGSPHNSGQVTDLLPLAHRFYRVRLQ